MLPLALTLTCALALTTKTSAAPPPQDLGTVRCLVVGIDAYPKTPLSGCVADATSVGNFLRQRFGPKRTKVTQVLLPKGKDPEKANWASIRSAIRKIARKSKPTDYFYFYFSGHGAKGTGNLVASDGSFAKEELAKELASVQACMTVVIVDSCFSGKLHKPLRKAIQSPTLIIATSVNGEQTSKTCHFKNGRVCPAQSGKGSVFTLWLLDCMRKKKNDQNGDGMVSWREAQRAAARAIDAADRYEIETMRWYQNSMNVREIEMTPVFYQRIGSKAR